MDSIITQVNREDEQLNAFANDKGKFRATTLLISGCCSEHSSSRNICVVGVVPVLKNDSLDGDGGSMHRARAAASFEQEKRDEKTFTKFSIASPTQTRRANPSQFSLILFDIDLGRVLCATLKRR